MIKIQGKRIKILLSRYSVPNGILRNATLVAKGW